MDSKIWDNKTVTSPHELHIGGSMGRLQGFSWQHCQGRNCENKYTPLSSLDLIMNIHSCAASVQVPSGSKSEEINYIL